MTQPPSPLTMLLSRHTRRREVIRLLSGAAAAWPLSAQAQPRDRVRHIGVLVGFHANDPQGEARVAAFRQGLQALGWIDGGNLRIDLSWGPGDADSVRKRAAEVMALAPEVVLAAGSSAMAALQQQTRALPIVFVQVVDPVGGGFVESLAAPGGNVTGFTQFEYGISGKWLELLKELAPRVTRVAILRDPGIAAGAGQLGAIQSVAPSFGVELRPVDVRDGPDIERGIATFARSSNGSLIATGANLANTHRKLIITLAARHKLPAVYTNPFYVADGGLISYGADPVDQYRRAASYVDRILKGEKPADLPVQAPTKYELVINLKTAKALGLEKPPTLLARADEVIE